MKQIRVAIIGAGASGLAAIKCCLDEGLHPDCYEKSDDIGGLWNFRDDVKDGNACVMRSTVINTSKEMTAYSDFPIPKDYANFMHNSHIQKYFGLYAKNFNLLNYIKFNFEVLEIKKSDQFSESGSWIVTVKDSKTGQIDSKEYDAVLICSGHHAETYRPKLNGIEKFKGRVMHTHEYRDCGQDFIGKNVLVIGVGNSGLDISVEISRVTKQTYLSTRRGAWVMHRIFHKGLPVDLIGNTRFAKTLETKILPTSITNALPEALCNLRFDHKLYGLKPEHRFYSQHPTINDDVPNRIICGAIKVKPNVKSVLETQIEFDDGTIEDDVDIIVLATGYTFGFPFLDKDILNVEENRMQLYKNCFIPNLERQTLAFIGVVQPTGSIMPISELQCRLAARIFKGSSTLPPEDIMRQDIQRKEDKRASRYVDTRRHTIQVDYILICDELAELIGCKPNILSYFWKDPKLAFKLFFGPCTPYQWRLEGPGKWEGAKEAIKTVWDRVEYPLKTRQVIDNQKDNVLYYYILVALIIAFIAIYFFL